MKLKKPLLLLLIFLLLLGVSGPVFLKAYNPWWSTGSKSYQDLTGYDKQELSWGSCYSGFKCANLSVPVDYSNPKKASINIALIKYPAAGKKIGSLVVNPGGPGASGIDYAYGKNDVISSSVLEKYDLIGFDPRGVARSAPISCLTNKERDKYYAENSKLDSPAKIAQADKRAKFFADKCIAKNKNLKFMTTENAARDMEVLRKALGEQKLDFLGNSYGTYLGALYLSLYPESAGKFVLDGAIDPTLNSETQIIDQANGFNESLAEFRKYCIDCDIEGLFDNFKTTKTKSGRALTESLAVYAVAAAMYEPKSGFPALKKAINQYKLGNPTNLLKLSDSYTGRDKSGNYYSNETEALDVISCLDWPNDGGLISAPGFLGNYLSGSNLACKYLPRVSSKKLVFKESSVLIINTSKDPSTPLKWAVGLNKIIPGSVLVKLNSFGHTGHNRGSNCVDSALNNFFITGQIPSANLSCELD